MGEALLDKDVSAGLADLINGYKDEFLDAIDTAPEQKELYQFIGERKACVGILMRLDNLRNRFEKEKG